MCQAGERTAFGKLCLICAGSMLTLDSGAPTKSFVVVATVTFLGSSFSYAN
jgi:hypothetical protein